MPKTYHMIGPNGKSYDIPEATVKQASRDGFRFATNDTAPLNGTPDTYPMVHPATGAVYDIPSHMVGSARNSGFRFAGAPQVPMQGTGVGTDLAIGAMKEGSNVAYNIGKLETKIGGAHAAAARARLDEMQREDNDAGNLTPSNTMQHIGGMGTDAAIFTALSMASPAAGKGMGALVTNGAITGGVGSGLISGGDPAQTAMGAMLGGAFPFAGRVAANGVKDMSSWLLNNALEVPKSVYARMNPGEYAIENGSFDRDLISFNGSKDSLRASAARQAKAAWQQGENLAANSTGRTSLASVRQLASDRATQWAEEGNQAFVKRANNLYNQVDRTALDITNNPAMQTYFPDSMQSSAAGRQFLNVQRPPTVTASDLFDVRRGLSTQAGWSANPLFHPQTIDLARGMYGQTNELLHNMVPGTVATDAAYSNLGTIGKLTDFKPSLWPWMMTGEVGAAADGGVTGAVKNMALYAAARAPSVPYTMGRAAMGVNAAMPMLNNAFLAGHSAIPTASSMYGSMVNRLHWNANGPSSSPSDTQGTNQPTNTSQ